MARSPSAFGSPPAAGRAPPSPASLTERFWGDAVLRSAFLATGLVVAYQLAVTLLHPAWNRPVTDWLRAVLAWPELLAVVVVSLWFSRTRQWTARSWWLLSVALLFYTVARDLWTVDDQFLFPDHVPFPTWPDLFFLLQYPFFFLALILLPRIRPWGPRARVVLDACLVMGAALALSWYFLLAPIFLHSHETLLGKLVSLSYPVGDLAILFGLIVVLARLASCKVERATLVLLIMAIACLVVADSWVDQLLLSASSYQAGGPPDLFWMAFYLLVALAALVQLRLTQCQLADARGRLTRTLPYQWQDLLTIGQFLLPIVVILLASGVILSRVMLTPIPAIPPLHPLLVILGLLVLVLLRQGLAVLETERLRREREEALRQTNAQMETFVGIAGHELKTPLASAQLGLQLVERRMRRMLQRERIEATDVAPLLEPLVQAERQEERLNRLVNDLLDVTRVRAGRLDLHLALIDLAPIVREAVEEQRQAHPERTILLELSEELRVPIMADAQRLGQVVTNYLTNALKYSPAERPVEVGLQVDGQQARLWVRDQGPGLPPEEQEHIWERFHRAKRIEVQSGTGVELGLGLHISQTIIEQHHGQVGVQSAPGQGSTFWFTLPLAPDTPASLG